ncbi:MAG: thymidylate synthase [Thermoplasmata archaeon M8B2D]|nr:MAG: thymidylate synthase [Thermoplasmata archaeon M8B2D]
MEVLGIKYKSPEVTLLNHNGIGVSEVAARSCYDSFENSEHNAIKFFEPTTADMDAINSITSSDLLDDLAWTYFHHSILEHSSLSFFVKGTSRGVLQEHARHRMQAISVRSTRYTMSGIINAFVASKYDTNSKAWFTNKILSFDMFVVDDNNYCLLEASQIFDKLNFQYNTIGEDEFTKTAIAKSSLIHLGRSAINADTVFEKLQAGKKKRNVGDAFKHIVSDNWKVDMVVTFNLRSLKNYFELRDSGAAYFQIQELAKQMKEVTPKSCLKLIDKKFKDE